MQAFVGFEIVRHLLADQTVHKPGTSFQGVELTILSAKHGEFPGRMVVKAC